MRMLFLGTPAIAVAPLEALHSAGYEIVSVVTQPDRPAGRHRTLTPPPVKVAAERLNLPILQPTTLKDPQMIEHMRQLAPDVAVVTAYGEILRREALAIPRLGYLNIHPSLLPLHRGPTPVPGAILAGDDVTGVSIIKLTSKMDAGPILAQATVPLNPDARAGELTDALMQLGSALLLDVLPPYAEGRIEPMEQDQRLASYTSLLTKASGQIDWSLPALVIERMTRAYDPWPGAWTSAGNHSLHVLSAKVHPTWSGSEAPGTLLSSQEPLIATGSGALELLSVQPAGKRVMTGNQWLHGLRNVQQLGKPDDQTESNDEA